MASLYPLVSNWVFHFQFVLFRDFMKEGELCQSKAALAKEVLAEIPEQFLSYMKKHDRKPNRAPRESRSRPLPPTPSD